MELGQEIWVKQKKELAELVGIETRNKYVILNSQQEAIGFAAEQGKGFWKILGRLFLGHWRPFTIKIFDQNRQVVLEAFHPFRWFFQRLELRDQNDVLIGSLQQKFSILYKLFEVESPSGEILYTMKSPIWRIWTFPIYQRDLEVARIEKKWGGLLKEAFLDADSFRVSFGRLNSQQDKLILLGSALFIDLQYFEKKADSSFSFSSS